MYIYIHTYTYIYSVIQYQIYFVCTYIHVSINIQHKLVFTSPKRNHCICPQQKNKLPQKVIGVSAITYMYTLHI